MSVQRDGKPAVTHYTVLERFRAHSSVEVRLETGRGWLELIDGRTHSMVEAVAPAPGPRLQPAEA